jgi:hypothetical protein
MQSEFGLLPDFGFLGDAHNFWNLFPSFVERARERFLRMAIELRCF